MSPSNPEPMWGFTDFAENFSGRLAMLGFFLGFVTEVISGEGILAQILSLFSY
ncbi:high light inducible protein [Acaryochloris sp. IP29b_bin.137]|uniref:high light inducible protein n=1 Tax=Acaryochloris sp. IP29b_bin.137 TaxID=2969217 RepID=UPI0026181F3C|nr:high light inducible protein [Acaryochloris sp. IP29b_bin.137]